MKWTAGNHAGLKFSGTYTKTPGKQYVGKLRIDDDASRLTALLLNGIVYVWDGVDSVESGMTKSSMASGGAV
jgi:hypothetical protein